VALLSFVTFPKPLVTLSNDKKVLTEEAEPLTTANELL